VLPMADQKPTQAIWTDEAVVESMQEIHSALNQWERIGAAEETDLDEMDETEQRFLEAMDKFDIEMRAFRERNRKK
jgi:hypothetical protein